MLELMHPYQWNLSQAPAARGTFIRHERLRPMLFPAGLSDLSPKNANCSGPPTWL